MSPASTLRRGEAGVAAYLGHHGVQNAEASQWFRLADSGAGSGVQDGSITAHELRAFLKSGCKRDVPLHFARTILRAFDTSGDGSLQEWEFLALYRVMKYCENYVAQVCVPARLAAGRPVELPGLQRLFMTKDELRGFLADNQLLPAQISYVLESAPYEEVGAAFVGGAGLLAVGGGGGGGGAVPGIAQLPGFFRGGVGGAGAFPGGYGIGLGAAPAAQPQEVLSYVGLLKVAAQLCTAVSARTPARARITRHEQHAITTTTRLLTPL